MAQPIIMPKAGMSMESGTIIKWLKSEGDPVEKGEVLFEIETDKTNMEVESEYNGVLIKILEEQGTIVPVTQVVGFIGKAGEKLLAVEPTIEIVEKEEDRKENVNEYDVIVVGGGPAGYIAAIKSARLGAKVALVEKDAVGGTCLNRGCIPTKTYLKTAEMIDHLRALKNRGVDIGECNIKIDMPRVVLEKDKVVKQLTNGINSLLKVNGVDVFTGEGCVKANRTVVIIGKETLRTQSVIYAGGSVAQKINIQGVESKKVITSDDILNLTQIPDQLAVIGGGVIGVEMATVFSRFGSKVHIIELAERIIPSMDAQISHTLKKCLEQQGIAISTSKKINCIEETGTGLRIVIEGGEPIPCDLALLSIGRVPDISGLKDTDVKIEKGRVLVDEQMRTNVPWIYAPGDVNGRQMLAHAAFKMGEVAALNAAGKSSRVKCNRVPACIYTMPEVGCVGLTEHEAKKTHNIRVGYFPFEANGRALASGESEGFVKVVTDNKYGEVLGVHIIGPNAAEMINEASTLMGMEITAEEIADSIHAHPTFSEAFMEAVADTLGESLHLPPK